MRYLDLLLMSVNNLRRRKLRTALTVLGVIIGTASIVVMVSLGIGLRELNRELIESYGSLTSVTVRADRYYGEESKSEPNYLTDEVVAQFARMEHVVSVYPMLEMWVMMRQGVYEAQTPLIGVPREYLEKIPLGQGQLPKQGSKELELIYGNGMVQQFYNSKTGRSFWDTEGGFDIDLMGKPMFVIFDMNSYYQSMSGDGTVKPPKKYMLNTAGVVEGTVDDYNEYTYSVYADIETLKTQLRKIFKKNPIPDQPTNKKGKPYNYFIYNSVVVNVDEMGNVAQVQQLLKDQGFQAHSRVDWMEQTEKQSNMIQAVLGGIGAVSLFVAAIGIANTMMMSIYERTKEIGVIKVLGCDMRSIRDMFLLESGFIGFMGGMIGIGFSYGVSFAMNRFLKIGEMMTGQAGDISRIPGWLALSAVVFAILVGMVAGFFPALRAMKLSPLAAIRNE